MDDLRKIVQFTLSADSIITATTSMEIKSDDIVVVRIPAEYSQEDMHELFNHINILAGDKELKMLLIPTDVSFQYMPKEDLIEFRDYINSLLEA